MARKRVEIAGIEFDIINSDTKKGLSIIKDLQNSTLKPLFDLYNRPSNTKISIYEDWLNWYCKASLNADFSTFGCLRGSSNFFSIGAMICKENIIYYFYITAGYNRVVIKGV